jgi:hypothetical protein
MLFKTWQLHRICYRVKVSNIIKPFKWLVFLCLILFVFLAYQFLPRPPENGSISYTELPHIVIMLGFFWSVSLFSVSILCRGLPLKPDSSVGFVLKGQYYLKLIITWYISVFMALYFFCLIFGTTSYILESVLGS